MPDILKGKPVAESLYTKIEKAREVLFKETKHTPCLATVLVGDDPASKTYVGRKGAACKKLGFEYVDKTLSEKISQKELNQIIDELNKDPKIDGILVQQPLPKHLSENEITDLIAPNKDVDCFSAHNIGLLHQGRPDFLPCTPAGVILMLEHYNIPIAGSRALVIGRSNIVGKPLAGLLLQKNATVQVAHSKTKDLDACIANSDIVVSAVGKTQFLDKDRPWNPDATVIDVGINRNSAGKLVGDVETETVGQKVKAISPVPGGVGPMTIAMLMRNTLVAAFIHKGLPLEKSGL